MDTPAAEVHIDEALIDRLVTAQHPDLAGDVRIVANGWDNVVARVGDRYAVRMPRRELAVELVRNEQRWLRELDLPVPIPVPVRAGLPGEGYPWPWSVVPWLEGTPVTDVAVPDRVALAADLGAAHRALHRTAPASAPYNPFRGVPLATRAEHVQGRLRTFAPFAPLEPLWRAALAVPEYDGPPRWVHGDPHPGNLLAAGDGSLAAILDFGDVAAGDPATDLAIGWLAFDRAGRAAYRAARDPDEALWDRARGWAVALTTAFVVFSDDNPRMRAIGDHALEQLLAEV